MQCEEQFQQNNQFRFHFLFFLQLQIKQKVLLESDI
jgi:hypothetical protein